MTRRSEEINSYEIDSGDIREERKEAQAWSRPLALLRSIRPFTVMCLVPIVFSPYKEPEARVKPGDRVTIHCNDAFENRIQSKTDVPSAVLASAKFLNPQTGPVYVEGAEPGDTLAVRIESIEPTRDFAVSCLVPYFGGLTSTRQTRTLQPPLPDKVWIWNLVDGNRLPHDDLGVDVPSNPFMGTLAVAPELEAISALAPGPLGGSMDVPDVKPGNTVYLPVWNEGTLFYTDDTHAAQGQDEVCGVALEISSKVTVVFDILKGKTLEWPRIESDEAIMVVGSVRPMVGVSQPQVVRAP